MYNTLLTSLEEGTLMVTIHRPDKLNALNKEVFRELNLVLDEIRDNHAIQSAIITGSGTKAFVAGADISELRGLTIEEGKAMAKEGQDTFFRIENSQKPIIACINGYALGGGCELAMSCHFRIASDKAKFGQPEINLGLIPGYGGTQRLVQLIGKGRAMEMILTGNSIDAATAHQYGLVNQVVTQEHLLGKAKELLQIINAKAQSAIEAAIVAVNASKEDSKNGFQVESEAFGKCFGTADTKEGIQAFIEKRKPVFGKDKG